MIDIFIVCLSFTGFISYILLQMLFLRVFPKFERLGFLFRLDILISVLIAGSVTFMFFLKVIQLTTYIIILIFSQLIYHGLVGIFMLTVFSYIESSVTLRLLSLIAKNGKDGITRNQIHMLYSKEMIISKRIQWFLSTKVIEKNGFAYVSKKGITMFHMRERVVQLMNQWFPPPDEQIQKLDKDSISNEKTN